MADVEENKDDLNAGVPDPVTPDPVTPDPVTPDPETTGDDDDEDWDDALDEVLGTGKKSDDKSDDDDDDFKTDEEKAAEAEAAKKAEEEAEAAKNQPEEKHELTTAEIVRDALREADNTRATMEATRKSYRQEVIDSLYPDGVERQLTDAQGRPINGVSDLKKLINPDTNEYFTAEEASEYLLEAQQKLNKELETFDTGIDRIVDTNIELQDGVRYISQEYGELLKAIPEEAKRIQEAYWKHQLVFDKDGKIIIGAKMPIAEFYDTALVGYKRIAKQMELKAQGEKEAKAKADAEAAAAKKAEAEAKVAAEKAAKAAQSEREDISQSGKPDQKSAEDAEWDDAFKQVLGTPRR